MLIWKIEGYKRKEKPEKWWIDCENNDMRSSDVTSELCQNSGLKKRHILATPNNRDKIKGKKERKQTLVLDLVT